LDFVIGVNENFQSSIINREVQKVYDFQEESLNFVSLDNDLNYYEYIDIPPSPTPTPYPTPTPTPTTYNIKGLIRFDSEDQMIRFGDSDQLFPFE
jgi:hypothetical protein